MKKNGGFACRFCGAALEHDFVDLGMSPLANSYLKREQLLQMEPFFPLKAFVCGSCFLVQLPAFNTPSEIFGDYAYFSSYSDSWLAHAKKYAEEVSVRFGLGSFSQVIEVASNDGYLLKNFKLKGVPVLGIEPARNVAQAAIKSGIPTLIEFFGRESAGHLAKEGVHADLLVGNNVLAHVPDINDFVAGMKTVLNSRGVITMEFPHLMRLMEQNQFDTIYHEHFSYFSLVTAEKIFAAHGLVIFDVDELPTHGGSLRIYARHDDDNSKPVGPKVAGLMEREINAGFTDLHFYRSFAEKVKDTKRKVLDFVIRAKAEGKSVAGYGAPAKGNTLLNYCGIRTDFIEFTVDRSPHKQGLYLPGTHIPVHPPEKIEESMPDYLVVLPWNLKEEIMEQMSFIRQWGGKFVVFIPEVRVL